MDCINNDTLIDDIELYITIHIIKLMNIISNKENINISDLIPYIFENK